MHNLIFFVCIVFFHFIDFNLFGIVDRIVLSNILGDFYTPFLFYEGSII